MTTNDVKNAFLGVTATLPAGVLKALAFQIQSRTTRWLETFQADSATRAKVKDLELASELPDQQFLGAALEAFEALSSGEKTAFIADYQNRMEIMVRALGVAAEMKGVSSDASRGTSAEIHFERNVI